MNPNPLAALLEDLNRGGFRLRLAGDRLIISPAGRLDPDLLKRLQDLRADVASLTRRFGPSRLLALFSDRPLTDAERASLAKKATELRDGLPRTENQCGQCLEWRPSKLVELEYSERIYLCDSCRPKAGAEVA